MKQRIKDDPRLKIIKALITGYLSNNQSYPYY